ncbi:MAG: hypothetical protein NTV81_03025 [Candidatus Komeilibacteria bacterium]|nr:hypothetical protein [Candidatus Komeilibacteria bacterium]
MINRWPSIIKRYLTNRKFWLVLSLILVLSLTIFSVTQAAGSVGVTDGEFDVKDGGVTGAVQQILLNVLLTLVKVVAKILLWFIGILSGLFSYNDFGNMEAIQVAWPLVRDLANIFFVVILLYIGFCTILRISSYEYKGKLLKFILMVLLINFSKTIFLFAIDASQVIMLTFVAAFREALVVNLVSGFGLTQVLAVSASNDGIQFGEIIISLFLAFIMMLVALGTMIAYAAVLIQRIITLWILLILSPLPFLLSIAPSGAKYSGMIWSKFGKELSTGIALGFFMWLAMTILSYGAAKQISSVGSQGTIAEGSDVSSETLFGYVICIALLWIGLSSAKSAGGFAGGIAGKVSGTLTKMGKGALVGAAGIGGAVSLRSLAGGVKNWRDQRKAASKEKWEGRAQRIGGALNTAQITAGTALKTGARKALATKTGKAIVGTGVGLAGLALGPVGLAGLGALGGVGTGLGVAGGLGGVLGLGHRIAKKFSPRYKSKVDDVTKGVKDFTDRNVSLADRKQLNKIRDTKKKKEMEEAGLRGEQAADIHASILNPEDASELARLKKLKKDEEKAGRTWDETSDDGKKLLGLEEKNKKANDAAFIAAGYQPHLEQALTMAKDAKEVEEILGSIPAKLREELGQRLDTTSLQTRGGIDPSKFEALIKTLGAANKVAEMKNREGNNVGRKYLADILEGDPSLVKSIKGGGWGKDGSVIGAMADAKVPTSQIQGLSVKQKKQYQAAADSYLGSSEYGSVGREPGEDAGRAYAVEGLIASGRGEAIKYLTPEKRRQMLRAGDIKSSSFKDVGESDLKSILTPEGDAEIEQAQAIIDDMLAHWKPKQIVSLQNDNLPLFQAIVERIQAKKHEIDAIDPAATADPEQGRWEKIIEGWKANYDLKVLIPASPEREKSKPAEPEPAEPEPTPPPKPKFPVGFH